VSQDYAEAVKWYCKAAEQGYAKAQYNLGCCFANDNGVLQDLTEAVKWFRKSAEQGHADAQYALGKYYYYGHGVNQNTTEAVKWWKKAAELGNAKAQYDLNLYKEQEKKRFEPILKALCRGITSYNTAPYECSSFRSLLNKVRETEMRYDEICWEFDFYSYGEVGTITLHSYDVLSIEENKAEVKFWYHNSASLENVCLLTLIFVQENGSWLVYDIIYDGGESWREECYDFISQFE
jgi:tetratricopeptide (TPR) repeat protein